MSTDGSTGSPEPAGREDRWRRFATGSENETEYHFLDGDEPYHDEAVVDYLNALERRVQEAEQERDRLREHLRSDFMASAAAVGEASDVVAALRDQLAKAEAERDFYREEEMTAHQSADRLLAENRALREENERKRAALQKIASGDSLFSSVVRPVGFYGDIARAALTATPAAEEGKDG